MRETVGRFSPRHDASCDPADTRFATCPPAPSLNPATVTAGLRKNRPNPISPRRFPPARARLHEPGEATRARWYQAPFFKPQISKTANFKTINVNRRKVHHCLQNQCPRIESAPQRHLKIKMWASDSSILGVLPWDNTSTENRFISQIIGGLQHDRPPGYRLIAPDDDVDI